MTYLLERRSWKQSGICFWFRAGRFTISELGDLMADHEDIFIKILTVVGVMEWVCLGLWLFYSSLSRLHT
jgi:hypothetical protein